MLANDRTGAHVVTGTDTEGCFLTTTRHCDVVLVLLTELLYSVNPISVVAEVVVDVGQFLVVVQLGEADVSLVRIEVSFLQHHGITVTIEHLVTIGLPCAAELVVEDNVGGTTVTTAQLDFDYTV